MFINQPLNAAGMKNTNKYNVLKYIRKGCLSRADISRLTNLTRASITYIVDDLYNEGYVIETGFNKCKVGKRSIQLSINPNRGYAIGVSITRDFYKVSLIDLGSNIIKVETFSDDNNSIKEILDKITQIIKNLIKKYTKKFLGIGIICPGPIDEKHGKILNPIGLNKWHYFSILEYFKNEFKVPCFLKKDVNSYALMEKTFNKNLDGVNFIDIISDRGLGSAIIINDSLLTINGFGSEIGHISINSINGRLCQCGNIGCLETYASTRILLNDFKNEGINFDSWNDVMDSLYTNNEKKRIEARIVLDKMVDYLGSALISFENIININNMVFTGILTYRPQLFYQALENYINSRMILKNQSVIHISSSSVDNIIDKAAANIVLEEFFNGNL